MRISDAEVRRLRTNESINPEPIKSRELRCSECGARCTRLLDG